MKYLVLCAWCLVSGAACLAQEAVEEEDLPRNPFWPQEYEGTRYPISAEPRFKPEPVKEVSVLQTNEVGLVQEKKPSRAKAKQTAPKEDDPLEDPIWNDAVKALRFGSALSFSERGKAQAAITINDRIYIVGDLLSTTFAERRFTWKIESLSTDGKIKLKRITYRKIGTNP